MPASLSFAKIVATATETAWSQVYHAGNLFALVSLTSDKTDTDLNALGKEMFNILESSFFSLEQKNLTKISEVIEESVKGIPETVTLSACIAFSKDAVLYLFLVGEGSILMKRGEKIGALLSKNEQDGSRKILSSSGFLNHEDVLLMQTGAFARLLTTEAVTEALQRHLPNDITEKLTTAADELPGDASAVTLMYQGASSPSALTPAQEMRKDVQEPSAAEPEDDEKETDSEEEKSEKEVADELPASESVEKDHQDEEEGSEKSEKRQSAFDEEKEMRAWKTEHPEVDKEIGNDAIHQHSDDEHSPVTVTRSFPTLPFALPSRKVLFGFIALFLLIALVFSIFYTKQQSQNSQTREVYEQTLAEATTKYEEAEGLKNLNAELAQDDYQEAARILKNGLAKVPKGSDEAKELQELLSKVEQNIVQAAGETVETKSVDISESPLLALAVTESSSYVSEDSGKQYVLTRKAVIEDEEDILENDDDWDEVAGLSVYNGNIYILDKETGILKFTAGSDGYGKSSYFGDDAPSLSQAVSMGIDGSVYVLFSNGSIKKYTRGDEESFTLSGLPSPLKSPKQLVAGTELESVYVFDRGNSRVIKLSKDGAFEKAWKANILATADLIDVQEDEKKIYILKGRNLTMLPMD